jgi:DNA-binding transcriptional MerR regulator
VDTPEQDEDQLLTPAEAAALRRVSPRSLRYWNARGLLPAEKTPGGHRRYRESKVRALGPEPVQAVA